MAEDVAYDLEAIRELAGMRMPYGRYAGRLLVELPEPYVVWLSRQGFPGGKLGEMLRAVYEIKVNGLEYLFRPLCRESGDVTRAEDEQGRQPVAAARSKRGIVHGCRKK